MLASLHAELGRLGLTSGQADGFGQAEKGRGMSRKREVNRRVRTGLLALSALLGLAALLPAFGLAYGDLLAEPHQQQQSLEQQCVAVALAKPEITARPIMRHAGIRVGDTHLWQVLTGGFEYPSLEDLPDPDGSGDTVNCGPQDVRTSGVLEQIDKGGRWVNIGPDKTGAIGNQQQHARLDYSPSHAKPAFVYDECVDGRFQKNRLVMTNYLKTGGNGHRSVVAQKRYILPVKVQGSCQTAIRSRQRYGR